MPGPSSLSYGVLVRFQNQLEIFPKGPIIDYRESELGSRFSLLD